MKSSLLTVVFHDIGKMCCPFQEMMREINRGSRPDYRKNYRHEVASFPYVLLAAQELAKKEGGWPGSFAGLEALAVLGHHKLITANLDYFDREKQVSSPVSWVPKGIEHAFSVANSIFAEEGFAMVFSPAKEFYKPFLEAAKFVQILPKLYERVLNERAGDSEIYRDVFLLLKAVLQYSDWYGSAKERIVFSPKLTVEGLEHFVRERCALSGRDFSGFTAFQKKCGSCTSNVIATAPTGSGKTEASLLWALNGFSQGRKLIYLLPTMVTSNSLFLRMADYFSAENVGLVHSTASLFKESELEGSVDRYSDVIREKAFMRPVTVSTVDQLLFSGFNKGFWSLIEANAAGSMIVIDEIHAYDAWTLGLICSAIAHFHRLGAKFFIMSATMPVYLKNLLCRCLPDAEPVEDSALLALSRSRYSVSDALIEESLDEISNEIRQGKKVLVVVNTVALCQSLAQSLSSCNPVCYHSRFIFRDRTAKEKEINQLSRKSGGCLVIATQVVEVSLDIDFDILFTECAPPDALVQRGGRVNRARKKSGTEVRVFRASEIAHKVYDLDNSGILEKTLEVLSGMHPDMSEQDLISLVDCVYEGVDIAQKPDFAQAFGQYASTQERLFGVLDNQYLEEETANECTRKSERQDEVVIPLCFKDEVLALDFRRRKEFELKIPLWYVRKHKVLADGILFCDLQYDSASGARYVPCENSNEFQVMV